MIRKLHSLTTRALNRRENRPGRLRLWQNFRETCLTHQRSYLARLHYVHQNAAHHKLVATGSDYPWCSADAFEKAVTPAWVKTIASFRYDEIAAKDGDEP
jgi:putative transposase